MNKADHARENNVFSDVRSACRPDERVTHRLHGHKLNKSDFDDSNFDDSSRRKLSLGGRAIARGKVTTGCHTCLHPAGRDLRGRTDRDHQHDNIRGSHPLYDGREHTDRNGRDSLFSGRDCGDH